MMMTIRCEEEEEMKTKRRENERTFCPILLHIHTTVYYYGGTYHS